MANLGDLKQRIIAETLRDDLADDMASDLNLIIEKSIDHYAANRWWFNEKQIDIPVVVGDPFVPVPADFRYLDDAKLRVGGVRFGVRLRQASEIDDRYDAGPINGQPTEMALFGTNFWLWPTPSTAWTLDVLYVADVLPLLDYSDDASANFWTNQGQDLITARAKLRLYRDYLSASLQDPRVVQANNQEAEAYSRLRSEHNRRLTTNTVRAGW